MNWWRQPFGPGLGVRVRCYYQRKAELCERIRRNSEEEIKLAGLENSIWQYFTVCPGCKSVGVKDGKRTYEE